MAPSCRAAFAECDVTESRTQQQVSDTLRSMGMAVEDEYICPLSGYSIDMLVRDVDASEQRRTGQAQKGWAVEFDGPHHFLTNKSPNGATLSSGMFNCSAMPSSMLPIGSGMVFAQASGRTICAGDCRSSRARSEGTWEENRQVKGTQMLSAALTSYIPSHQVRMRQMRVKSQ